MPDIQPIREHILTENHEHSQPTYKVDRIHANPWWHVSRARDWIIANGKTPVVSAMQRYRNLKAWHGRGWQHADARDAMIRNLHQQRPKLTSQQVADHVNARYSDRLGFISASRVRQIWNTAIPRTAWHGQGGAEPTNAGSRMGAATGGQRRSDVDNDQQQPSVAVPITIGTNSRPPGPPKPLATWRQKRYLKHLRALDGLPSPARWLNRLHIWQARTLIAIRLETTHA